MLLAHVLGHCVIYYATLGHEICQNQISINLCSFAFLPLSLSSFFLSVKKKFDLLTSLFLSFFSLKGCQMSPPCLEYQGCHLIPLYISSLVLLPSPVTLSVFTFFLAHSPELFPENASIFFFKK